MARHRPVGIGVHVFILLKLVSYSEGVRTSDDQELILLRAFDEDCSDFNGLCCVV